jgi:hypothetical protein
MQKLGPGSTLSGTDRASLSAARGECASFQIAVKPPVQSVRAVAGPLAAAGGSPIPIALYREVFLDLAEPSNSEGRAGKWPDPLIPERDAYVRQQRSAFPASSEGPLPVVLYCEVCIPDDASPGEYHGAVALEAEGKSPLAIPVDLAVRRFAIPPTSTLPTSFGFSGASACAGHRLPSSEQNVRALTRLYATAALRHRISLHGMTMEPPPLSIQRDGSMKLDFAAYDEEVGPFLDGTATQGGARFTSIDARLHPQAKTDDQKIAYLRAFAAHLRQRGWLQRAFVYAKDEPRPEELPAVQAYAGLVHRADPALRVLVTASLVPIIERGTDIFCPNLNCLFDRPGARYCPGVVPIARYAPARSRGATLWWYQSCGSHGCGPVPLLDFGARAYFAGWPSYMVDHDAALNRAMGPLAFLSGIEGELYFNTVEAYLPPKGEGAADPWKSIWRFHGNGDGTLFYPGMPERVGGADPIPIESLRLKFLRDGLQDYEYLVLARKLGLKAEAEAFVRSLAPRPFEIARSPERWEHARRQLGDAIELRLSRTSP